MNQVLAYLNSKRYDIKVCYAKKIILTDSICYSCYYLNSCKYFRFSYNGDSLLCFGIFDGNTMYIIGWKYEYMEKLTPQYIISNISLHYASDNSQYCFSLYQHVDNLYWVTILQEHHQEAPYSFSIFSTEKNEIITCRTNIQQYSKTGPFHCAFTLHNCCLILPSRSSLNCIVYHHSNAAISADSQYRFSKRQARRKLQKQLKLSKLSFLESKQEKWIFEDDLVDVTLSHNSIHYDSIQSETHNFEHLQTNQKLSSIYISLSSLLSNIFPKKQILYFTYCYLGMMLCDECCPLPHMFICFSVLLSFPHTKQSLHIIQHSSVVVEMSLHDETFYTKKRESFVEECTSFSILHNVASKKWSSVNPVVTSKTKEYADNALRETEKRIKRHLYFNDFGRGYYYSSEMKFNFVVNPVYGDTIISL